MKRTLACVLLAALLCALLCACGSSAFQAEDISLTVSGVTVTTDSAVPALLDAFGSDYTYAEAISCVYTGMDKTYQYPSVTIYTYPDGEEDRLMELCCTADVTTARGISLGASRQDVEAAYGQCPSKTGSLMTYSLPEENGQTIPAALYFELQDGAVSAIGIICAHRAE